MTAADVLVNVLLGALGLTTLVCVVLMLTKMIPEMFRDGEWVAAILMICMILITVFGAAWALLVPA